MLMYLINKKSKFGWKLVICPVIILLAVRHYKKIRRSI